MARILVVDDDPDLRDLLVAVLEAGGFEAESVSSAGEALTRLGATEIGLVLSDVRMDGMTGLDLVEAIRKRPRPVPVILMTAFGGVEEAIDAMKAGADDFLQKPIRPELVLARVRKVLESSTLRRRVEELEGLTVPDVVHSSPTMGGLFAKLPVVARSDVPVLLTGETGTGKDVVARAIHRASGRRDHPFVAVNCGAIPENLLESELFGHRKGAFTGADRDKNGLFAEANGGTLFLDEVGDFPLSLQVKILRALEEGQIRPVGGTKPVPVDVRIIAATHVDIAAAVAEGRFRQDLYYRLAVVLLHIPPLRERPEDLVDLVQRFLRELGARHGRPDMKISPEALRRLERHSWPGNIRELRNRLTEAMLFATDRIEPEHLNLPVASESPLPPRTTEGIEGGDSGSDYAAARRTFERAFLKGALDRSHGNVVRAAEETGLSRRQLYNMFRELQIDPKAFR
jgi:two-component system response regulator GlrR